MSGVFIYWDNSNTYHEAQRIAEEQEGTPGARYLLRIQFDNLLRLAHADRTLEKSRCGRFRSSGDGAALEPDGEFRGRSKPVRSWCSGPECARNCRPMVAVAHARGRLGQQRRSWNRGPADRRRSWLRSRTRFSQHVGTDASTRVANRSPVLDSLVQARNARVGAGQRRLCPAGRLLLRDHLP